MNLTALDSVEIAGNRHFDNEILPALISTSFMDKKGKKGYQDVEAKHKALYKTIRRMEPAPDENGKVEPLLTTIKQLSDESGLSVVTVNRVMKDLDKWGWMHWNDNGVGVEISLYDASEITLCRDLFYVVTEQYCRHEHFANTQQKLDAVIAHSRQLDHELLEDSSLH